MFRIFFLSAMTLSAIFIAPVGRAQISEPQETVLPVLQPDNTQFLDPLTNTTTIDDQIYEPEGTLFETKIPSQLPAQFGPSHTLVQQAGHWSNYQSDVHYWGSRNIGSATELETALIDFARYDGAQMAPGWMATGALMALQTPEYVDGIRQWEKLYGRDILLERLHSNPMFSLMFPGTDDARQTILRAAISDADHIKLVGSLFKEQAYSMQKKTWANRKQGGKSLRLSAITMAPKSPKAIRPETLMALAAPGMQQLDTPYNPQQARTTFLTALKLGPRPAWANSTTAEQTPHSTAPGREITMAHMLALTALLVLGEDENHPDFIQWTDDRELRECVDWSRIHLQQCVAAGHFVFESSFCIAEHQLIDGGKCVGDLVAGSRTNLMASH